MMWRWWFGLVLCSIFAGPAHARTIEVGNQARYELLPHAAMLVEQEGTLTLGQAMERLAAEGSGAAITPRQFRTSGEVWAMVVLRNTGNSNEERILEVAKDAILSLDVFVERETGGFSTIEIGRAVPTSALPISHRHHLVPVPLPPGRETRVLVRARSLSTIGLTLVLWEREALWLDDIRSYGWLGLYFGLIGGLILYSAVLYSSTGERPYLWYLLFALSMAATQVSGSGVAGHLVWPDAEWWRRVSPSIFFTLLAMSTICASRAFLRTGGKVWKLLDRWIAVQLVLFTVQLAGGFLSIPMRSFPSINGFSVVGILVLSCFAGFRQRLPGGKLFAMGWLVLAATALLIELRRTGVLPVNLFTQNVGYFGPALEQFLFAVAITMRLRAVRAQALRDKAHAEQAVLRQQIAEQQSMEKSHVFSTLAHDVRQPLYSIQLVLDGAAFQGAKLQVKKQAHEVERSIAALGRLLDSMLLAPQLEARTITPCMSRVDVKQILLKVQQRYQEEARDRNLQLRLYAPACWIETDEALMEALLGQVVWNALRNTQRGGVLIALRRRDGHRLVQVWDTGGGIDVDRATRILGEDTPFGSKTQALGLATIRELGRLVRSPISVRARAGRGSCFEIGLVPAAAGALAADAAPARVPIEPAVETPALAMSRRALGLRVLVVDDDEVAGRHLGQMLEAFGCAVAVETDPEQALRVSLELRPQVVLSDLHLGTDADGIALIESLRTHLGTGFAAALISSDTSLATARRARACGVRMMNKPVSPERIASLLDSLVTTEGLSLSTAPRA